MKELLQMIMKPIFDRPDAVKINEIVGSIGHIRAVSGSDNRPLYDLYSLFNPGLREFVDRELL